MNVNRALCVCFRVKNGVHCVGYTCMYVRIQVCRQTCILSIASHLSRSVDIHTHIHIYIYIYIHIHIYTYIRMYTFAQFVVVCMSS
jgi:hypothetical protein